MLLSSTAARAPRLLPIALVPIALALLPACATARQAPGELQLDRPTDLAPLIERFATDERALESFYEIRTSPTRIERLERFDEPWRARLAELDFDALERPSRVDYVLLRNHLDYQRRQRETQRGRLEETLELVPFAATLIGLEEGRWRLVPVEGREAAATLDRLAEEVEAVTERVKAGRKGKQKKADDEAAKDEPENAEGDDDSPDEAPLEVDAVVAVRVAGTVDSLRSSLGTWYDHYEEFVPGFAWWTAEPKKKVDQALRDYSKLLRETIAEQKGEDDDPLIGDPIGRARLLDDLAHEMLPYAPEQLVAIADEQFAWCEREMLRAAADMGHGDDWRAALEEVKQRHVPPGEQDALVERLAREAIDFLDHHDLVTIPELCRETWRVQMLDRRGQRTLPFAAYGGQKVMVAYPTSDMDHQSKLMAMRGNNIHFTRAVTPHELIPGHHLQGFMAQRYATHRRSFRTPFLTEGWALYWEMLEWDLGWPKTPEDRIGMLFWRMHRAARIIVSLRFHLEEMSPEEMIDFLVERVGHERDNATSEVRRFINGSYSPLYQCAYMIGGLQLRALADELVGGGRMRYREFHDAVLRLGPIPVEMIRASLTDAPLTREHVAEWEFAGSR